MLDLKLDKSKALTCIPLKVEDVAVQGVEGKVPKVEY